MKTINYISMQMNRGAILAGLAGLALLTSPAIAQEKAGERLAKPERVAMAAQPATPMMNCGKCQDVAVRVANPAAKGGEALLAGGQPTKLEAQHACGDCKSKNVTQGVGKQAKDVAKHDCTMAGSEAGGCCAKK